MSNYTPSTNFATKDTLPPGDPLKIVRGTEINTEFTNIAVAVATKFDTTALASPGPIGATTPAAITGTNIQATSYNGGQLAGLRNRIINGNMDIFQRGTAAVTTNATYGPADRWRNEFAGGSISTTQGTFVSGDTLYDTGGAQYFTQVAVTSPGTGAGNYCLLSQNIEDVRLLAGQTVTVSFWAKAASGTPSIGVAIDQYFGTGGSTAVTGVGQAQALTTTWTQYSKTFTVASVNGKTIGPSNTSYNACIFWLDAGSNFNSRSGTIGQASKTVSIAQVQLEVGPVATPFEQRPYGMEYSLCARYYWTQADVRYAAYMIQNDSIFWSVPYGVPMRTNPSITSSGGTALPATTTISFFPSVFGYTTNLAAGASGTTSPGRHFVQSATIFANAEL